MERANPARDGQRILEVGGPAFDYRDAHLHGVDGVQPGAAIPSMHVVVLMVDFDDEPMGAVLEDQPERTMEEYFDRAMTHLDQMYSQMSGGQFTITWEILPTIYRLPEPMSYYGLDDSIATREATLCQHAVWAADPDVDFSQFNSFMLFHAGGGQEADINDDSREEIWSVFFRQFDFGFWLNAPDAEKGIRTQDLVNGEPFYVTSMVVLPEYEAQDGYDFGLQGVVAHEFGHGFGLPDLYDTTGKEGFIFADSQGIGTFGLMGAGIWNASGYFPAEMCAWSKFYVGWLRPQVLLPTTFGEGIVTLEAVQLDRREAAVRIPLGGDEYFLIENRIRDYNVNGKFDFDDVNDDGLFDFWEDSYIGCEFDWHLPQEFTNVTPGERDGSGLLIWHIDESIIGTYLMYNLVNADALHKGIDLEEADGIQDLDKLEFVYEAFGDPKDAWFAPYATEFTPNSEPNSHGYNDAYSGVWITDISGAGPEMSFRLRFTDASGDRVGDFVPGWPLDLPGLVKDFQPVVGDLDGDGTPEIVTVVTSDSGQGGVAVYRPDGTPFLGSDPFIYRGVIRSDPLLVQFRIGAIDRLEIVFVSGDSLLAWNSNGVWIDASGNNSVTPAPFQRLDRDPGRLEISAGDLDNNGTPEIFVGTRTANPIPEVEDWSNMRAFTLDPVKGVVQIAVSSHRGSLAMPLTLADLDSVDGGLMEMIMSVRDRGQGYLGVGLLAGFDGDQFVVDNARYDPGDSVTLSAPVVGDLNRDGFDDIVVADSNGFLHAFNLRIVNSDGETKIPCPADRACDNVIPGSGNKPEPCFHNSCFFELPGWPVNIGSTGDDELSLADVDGDGYLEVLAFSPINRLWTVNYNGTFNVATPVNIPAEDKYLDPFLAPLVLDVDGTPGDEFVLPVNDGQVRAHDARGKAIPGWAYLGGGNQEGYPVIHDLDGDGRLELITTEDVTVAIPSGIQTGDTSPGLPRTGRLVVRQLGPGTGTGAWPVYRGGPMRGGRVVAPTGSIAQPVSGLSEDVFVAPNPVVDESANLHYRIRSDVSRVIINIHDVTGTEVVQLSGSIDDGVDNLLLWDLTNDNGTRVAPGLYIARFEFSAPSGTEVEMVKFVVLH